MWSYYDTSICSICIPSIARWLVRPTHQNKIIAVCMQFREAEGCSTLQIKNDNSMYDCHKQGGRDLGEAGRAYLVCGHFFDCNKSWKMAFYVPVVCWIWLTFYIGVKWGLLFCVLILLTWGNMTKSQLLLRQFLTCWNVHRAEWPDFKIDNCLMIPLCFYTQDF